MIKILNRYTGKLIKEFDIADLSDADLHDADLRDANLRRANLHDANLRRANLSDAYLRGADLRRANLHDANLRRANLRGADLSDADLRRADLSDADLSDANLRDATGDGNIIITIQTPFYTCNFFQEEGEEVINMLQIGCKIYPCFEWWEFSDAQIDDMDNNALNFWKTYKPFLQQAEKLYFGDSN